jgi:UMF1 family MFS transporter
VSDSALPSSGSALATSAGTVDRSVRGWILYDFANVIFSTNVVSVYFPIWVVDNAGGTDGHYGVASGLSLGLVCGAAPFLGSLLDRIGRRMPLLIAATLATCLFTLFIGAGGLYPSLALFFLANICFQSGVTVYDSYLPDLSTEERRGWLSGAGIAAGFGGSVAGLLIGLSVLSFAEDAKPLVFKLTAIVFLLASLPCFLWVREPAHRVTRSRAVGIRDEVRSTRSYLRANPALRRFLASRFIYTDAANTLIAFLGIYATKELGFSDLQIQLLLLSGILIGPAGALLAGRWTDRIGAVITLRRTLFIWLAALTLAAVVPLLDLPENAFWLIAPLVGIALGATAACDRPALLTFAHAGEYGRAFGLYAMVGRFSAVTGPLIWAGIVSGLGFGRPVAVLSLVACMAIAIFVLNPLAGAEGT